MKFEFEKLTNTSCVYKITIDKDELSTKEQRAKNKVISKIKIPGFRKNTNLPKQIVARYLTKESIAIEATRLYLQDAYEFALEQMKKENVAAPSKLPEVKIDLTENLEGILLFTFTPESKVKIPILSTMKIDFNEDDYKINKKLIDEEIEQMKDELSTMILREGDDPIKVGDTVIIDYEGTLNGESFSGGSAKNHELVIGSKKFLPGFEEQLVGLKTDEKAVLPIHFPKDYFIKHLRGMTIDFSVHVHEIRFKEKVKNEEEFIKLLNKKDVKTLKDVRKLAKSNLEKKLKAKRRDDYWRSTLNAALKNGDFYYPEDLVTKEFNKIKRKAENELNAKNLSIKMYAEVLNVQESTIYANMKREAEWKIKQELAIVGIAQNLGIRIEEKDIVEYAKTLLQVHQPNISDDALNKFVSSQRGVLYHLLLEKETMENVLELLDRSTKSKKIKKIDKQDKPTNSKTKPIKKKPPQIKTKTQSNSKTAKKTRKSKGPQPTKKVNPDNKHNIK